ncbi:antibiotic biosynthesis monooxygenase [Aquincola sp. J276]|uniref:antibiotic biosynthesis monooxygenase family protein n=1 Tax=Aquincola sp. J276 TaxID=2898432 RepID=UPI0021519E80|nr:antibiotic biosynthesis monooxygenase [Aquincola sp. J276]MCR5865511.1 antibiotic biosynthesis monooxygenase [Aquincola sp. J276]
MYTSTFTFLPRQYDDAFHALDQVIAEVARSIPGYLGEEAWENPATGLVSNVYYWESMDALQALMRHPSHVEAKQAQSRWLNGYQVVIAQVVGSYGDGRIAHPLAGQTVAPSGCLSEPDPAPAYQPAGSTW